MNFKVNTAYDELTLKISIQTNGNCKIRLIVWDEDKPNTVFENRYMYINGYGELYVRMPISPENAIICIYNENNGNRGINQDPSFSVVNIERMGLDKRMDLCDMMNPKIRSFLNLAERFAFNSAYLPANKCYHSDDKQFTIEFLPTITDQSGRVMSTPARINKITGRIQISQARFKSYTVPMQLAILLHEFAHFNMNDDMNDETEADLNGLLLYLGKGYPRIEAHRAYLEVFETSDTRANQIRWQIIKKFIDDFENDRVRLTDIL